MRKLGFGVLAIIAVAGIYYFASGSAQITKEMKEQVNNELVNLKENGFAISEREIKESQEHFVLDFNDSTKIASFLSTQGIQAKSDDLTILKGMKIGVDLKYLDSAKNALSADLYPLSLPNQITKDISADNKQALLRIEKMLKEKSILIHVDFNKLLSGFTAYVKDINETFEGVEKIQILAKGMNFEGDIENKKLKHIKKDIEQIELRVSNELNIKFLSIKGNHALLGPSPYDTSLDYSIKNIELKTNQSTALDIKNIISKTRTSAKDSLLNSKTKTSIEEINMQHEANKYKILNTDFNVEVDNLNARALEKLQKVDSNDKKEIKKLLKEMLEKGIKISISSLSSKSVVENGSKLGGFSVNASARIDNSLDIDASMENPLMALQAVLVNSRLTLSSKLFSLAASDPKAMIFLMFFPPHEEKTKSGETLKVFDINFTKGSLSINGVAMF